jgi:uncharacterized protein
MKFLLFLLVILFAVWLWRSGRKVGEPQAKRQAGPARPGARGGAPQDMVRCAVCGLHLPLSEAASSARAHYCSTEHRRQAEPGAY